MEEIVKKLLFDCEEYITDVFDDFIITYTIKDKTITLKLGKKTFIDVESLPTYNFIGITVNNTNYILFLEKVDNLNSYQFQVSNKVNAAIIEDRFEKAINNFRQNQLYKLTTELNLIEPEEL